MEIVLQNPQQCIDLLQLFLYRTKFLMIMPSTLRSRLVPGPSIGEDEVETPSKHSTDNGIPLKV
jgi:hypothetical protein